MQIQTLFDTAAQDYDRTRRQYIPCFDEFYGTVLEVLPFGAEETPHILDLGAGTGLLTALLAQALPQARFTLVDIAPQMLEQAEIRFGAEERFQYQVVDYLREELPGPFDAVVSALSLHHTEHTDLPGVFEKIHHSLKPGGLFINADQALGATLDHEAMFEARWENQARELGCSDEDIAVAKNRMLADRTATLQDQLNWLQQARFSNVECWYKNFRFVVYSGQK